MPSSFGPRRAQFQHSRPCPQAKYFAAICIGPAKEQIPATGCLGSIAMPIAMSYV